MDETISVLPGLVVSEFLLFSYHGYLSVSAALWEMLCNAAQMQMTNLKLQALGFHISARLCKTCMCVALCAALVDIPIFVFWFQDWTMGEDLLLKTIFFCCCAATLLVQSYGLCHAASRALCLAWHDAAIRTTAACLYINAALVIPGPLLSGLGALAFHAPRDEIDILLLTADASLQVLNVLLLSGLVGPQQWARPMEALQKLAEIHGFGLSSKAKRIAFPGRVNPASSNCIVSFPGKYSEQWDAAVLAANSQEGVSLACVFLTDRASGLGQHADNPHSLGSCWCHALYGSLPANTYLSVVDVQQLQEEHGTQSEYQQALDFKKADAVAMGQLLLIKQDQAHLDWERHFV